MENFIMHNPTSLHFGRGVVNDLGKTLKPYGSRALLVYGKGSVKRNGVYDDVIRQLREAGIEWVEFSGIKPNPVVEDVDAAVELGMKEEVDMVLAIGGGSVIDSAKFIALGIPGGHKGWDIMTRKARPTKALPIFTVLTLAATGTEMNSFAVLQNHATRQKLGFGHPKAYPTASFLDPAYTMSVNREYTAYGIMDLIAHSLEAYFGEGDAPLSDKIVYGIIREAMEAGPALLGDLQNYELRARIMYAATLALNGSCSYGRANGDWGVHSHGHILSLLFDMPHGATLSIVYLAWLKQLAPQMPERITALGNALFGTDNVESTLIAFEKMLRSIASPAYLHEMGIGESEYERILETMNLNKCGGNHFSFSDSERAAMLRRMM
jgi:alcohol dehydrogenase YqhD (iron-dependent ADH family)